MTVVLEISCSYTNKQYILIGAFFLIFKDIKDS